MPTPHIVCISSASAISIIVCLLTRQKAHLWLLTLEVFDITIVTILETVLLIIVVAAFVSRLLPDIVA